MTADAHKVRSIFLAAVENHARAQWDAYLDAACAGDSGLRRRVQVLLQAHAASDRLLDDPGLALFGAAEEPLREGPGSVIGPYKLLEELGEGGFGVVFLAEQQQPIRRQVAFKVLKPGMDTRPVIARFEAERQALALMDHPNIARVLDGGTTGEGPRDEGRGVREEKAGHDDLVASSSLVPHPSSLAPPPGRPYVVMELVRGAPITDDCDQHQLTLAERLALFLVVCQAVQHAHHKGIIHRDLKPSNVLVTREAGTPVVKVIDFGIAKALGPALTANGLTTDVTQMIGTPVYMSPEQAEPGARDIDTRSDIYSLGVLFYELLTGTTPVDQDRLKQLSPEELRRIIREEDSPRPSTRITTLGPAASAIAARRRSDPGRLSQSLRGELDWIVMKALEKDRTRRYESASALAADVQCYLNDEPVQAGPPSAVYRLRKWARRHRPLVAAGLAGLLTAIATWAVSTVLILRQRDEARMQRELAQAQQHAAQEQRERARQAVDDMYTEVAEKWLAQQPRLQEVQRRFLLKALHYYERFAQEPGTDPALRHQAAAAHKRVGDIQYRLGNHAAAEAAYRQAIQVEDELAAAFPATPEYRHKLGYALQGLGTVLVDQGRYADAEPVYRRALALRAQLAADVPTEPHYRWDLAKSHNQLGLLLEQTGRYKEAEAAYREAIGLHESAVTAAPDAPGFAQDLAKSRNNLAALLASLGRAQEAEDALRQALAAQAKLVEAFADVPEYRQQLAATWNNLAVLLVVRDQLGEAEQTYRQALAVEEKLVADFPKVTDYRQQLAGTHFNLAVVLEDLETLPEAERAYRRAAALYETITAASPGLPNLHHDLARCYYHFGGLLEKTRGRDQALSVYRQAVASARQAVKAAPRVGSYHRTLGVAQCRAGDWQAALESLHKAVDLGAGDVVAWLYLALAHGQRGEKELARPWYDRASIPLDKSKRPWRRFRALRAEAAAVLGLPRPVDPPMPRASREGEQAPPPDNPAP